MDNNLISNILQLERTNLIRGGTGNSYAPFELKLQLHGQVNNPYTVSVKSGYKTSASISVDVPAYTEKSWTTSGTYTWTVPNGITRIRAAVCGGGGGSCIVAYESANTSPGTTSSIKLNNNILLQATSGTYSGVIYNWANENHTIKRHSTSAVGSGGIPNGTNGYSSGRIVTSGSYSIAGGFSLSFDKSSGNYGKSGTCNVTGYSWVIINGSGGYNSNYLNVSPNTTLDIIVGQGGVSRIVNDGKGSVANGTSGFVLIAYGQGIE